MIKMILSVMENNYGKKYDSGNTVHTYRNI